MEEENKQLNQEAAETKPQKERQKIFQRFKVKDIVFLAILSAVTIVTSAVMPLVATVPIFGIAQIVTGIQMTVFPAIAIMKVRKTGSLFFMALFTGIVQLMMAPPMFFSSVLNGFLVELLVVLIFRGYKNNVAVFFAVALYHPLSLPFNYLYNMAIGKETVTAIADAAPWTAVAMTAVVIAISVVGTLIGMKIAKELQKTGALKK